MLILIINKGWTETGIFSSVWMGACPVFIYGLSDSVTDTMVNACPVQSDPRPNVSKFISDNESVALAGLVTEGLDSLLEIVIDELRKQEPDSNIILVERDLLSDEDITFAREFADYIDRKLSEGKKLNLVINGDIPVSGWNTVLDRFNGKDLQIFYGAQACRQVPVCTRIKV